MKAGVFGLGAITVDFLGSVDRWPEMGTKTKLQDFDISGGGLVGNAIATVSRLGGKAYMAGKLGNSLMAGYAMNSLREDKVDTSNIIRQKGSEPVKSFILSDIVTGERSIFFTRELVNYPFPDEFPDQEWYRKVKVLLIDHGTGKAGIETALIARKHGVQVVIDAERTEPHLKRLLSLSDHIIVGEKFAFNFTGTKSDEAAAAKLQSRKDQIVVITKGERGLTGLDKNGFFRQPAFNIKVIDTTGCGDVFHGAYALGIAKGWDAQSSYTIAGAAAALSASKMGGRKGIPSRTELNMFLKSRGFNLTL